ncbi:MAG: FtsX-like permease family protein, partial [bacterium]|nr:FtsX-like permease family protein [bacterium]
MRFILSLAYKNLLRYKKRTILTFLILSVGIAFYIWIDSFLVGVNEQSFDNVINFETGHFKIQSKDYDEDKPFAEENFMKDYETVIEKLKTKNYVTAYTQRIKFTAEMDNATDSAPCIVIGIDLKTYANVFSLPQFIEKGSLEPGGVMVGKTLAEDLKLELGDFIYITFREEKGMYNSIEAEVTGIIYSPDPATNNSTVFINLNEAKEFLNTSGITEIAIKTDDHEAYKKYREDLLKSIPGFQIKSWVDMSQDFLLISQTKKKFSSIFVFFIIVIALVGIINTVLMSVLEKKKEIGTLKALGFTDNDILKMFLFEGAIIGFLGSIFGIILSILLNWYFVEYGWDMSSIIEEMGSENVGYRIMSIAKSAWTIKPMIQSVLVATIVSMAASYYPAKQAVKMEPAECL